MKKEFVLYPLARLCFMFQKIKRVEGDQMGSGQRIQEHAQLNAQRHIPK